MKMLRVMLIGVIVLLGGSVLAAQDGGLDLSFDPGTGMNTTVYSIITLPDDRILVGGAFHTVNGVTRHSIARLHPDGAVDMSFEVGGTINGSVNAMALLPDGKILIAGAFTSVNSTLRNRIARLHPDGGLDMDFDPGLGPNAVVRALALQADGKILIGGTFTTVNLIPRALIARLHPDGSFDPNFDANATTNAIVHSIIVQSDGRILVGGNFTSIGGTAVNRIARLHPDGSRDPSFDPGPGANVVVFCMARQPDGRILVGGSFTTISGAALNRIARLNADGSLDTDFDPGAGMDDFVRVLLPLPDGKILVGGAFTTIDDEERNYVGRLNADGSLDAGFDPDEWPNYHLDAIALQGRKILIGGQFTFIGNVDRKRIARLDQPSPVFTSVPETTATATKVYTYPIQALSTPDPTLSVSGLPEWLSFDGIDTISGTPHESHIDQNFGPITITATNNWGEATQTFYIEVVGIAPQFTSAPATTATVGFPYEYIAMATGVPAPTLSAAPLPDWLTFDAATGELSGAPPGSAVGTAAYITITATGWGEPAEQTFTITVASPFGGGGAGGGGGGCAISRGGNAAILAIILAFLGAARHIRFSDNREKL